MIERRLMEGLSMSEPVFSGEVVVGKVVVEQDITEKDIEDIIVGAVEGGTNGWMGIDARGDDWLHRPKGKGGVAISTWIAKMLIEGKEVHLYDTEDNDERWVLTLPKLIEGIRLNAINRKWDTNMENWDSASYSCVIQYAIMGSVEYDD